MKLFFICGLICGLIIGLLVGFVLGVEDERMKGGNE